MLNEHQIEMLPERIYQRLNGINTAYLESIGRTIKEIGALKPSDVHKLQQMYNYGSDVTKITSELANISGKNVQDIYDIFDIVAQENYDYSKPFYEAQNLPFVPYEDNEQLQRYVESVSRQTAKEYINLTQHTAFAVFDKGGKSIAPLFAPNKDKIATDLSDTYTKVVDLAVSKVQLGETDYKSAMREVMRSMVSSGIKTVDYATGYSRRLDTTARQNILWGAKQCNQNTADIIGEQFGANGYEISYHGAPRPSHSAMGGKQYAISKARTVKGVYYPSFSDVEKLLEDFGCLHFKFSILLGISQPAYSPEQLAQFKADDERVFEFEGKKYSKYEATQVQRKLETEMRKSKDLANIAKAADDDDLRREAQSRINLLTSKYKQFSDASGLPTKMERAQVSGFRPVKAKNNVKKTVDKSEKSGIIKSKQEHDLSELGKFKQKLQSDASTPKEYYSTVKTRFSHGSEDAKRVFNKYVPSESVAESEFTGRAHYDTKKKKVYMSYAADMNNPRGNGITYFHEHGHMVDDLAGTVSKDEMFRKILDSDVMAYRRQYGKEHGLKTFDKVDACISSDLNSMRKHSGVSDMFEGLTKGNISGVAGHSPEYWAQEGNIESESFAHMFASQFDDTRYEEMQRYFPNALKYFENKLKEL